VIGGLAKGGRYRAREVRDEESRTALLDYLSAAKRLFALKIDAPVWTRHDLAGAPGEPLTSHAFVHNLKRYAAEAGIDHVHLHQTRHTFARIVAEETGSFIQTQDALEHRKKKWSQRFGQACGHLKKVTQEVGVIKDGKRYWVTNELSLSPAQIKRVYRNRQQIEETFRLLKQEFGGGGSSVRKAAAQTAHLHLGLMALCLTQQAALAHGQTVYAFKHDLFRQPIPDQLPFTDYYSVAA
jgi:DDE family transposase/integrase-like protein